ncbi:MAG: ATP-dependent metallopeptidase FtsH/Yme1/Tma family protein [Clostridiales bacterium]|jgi:cell division protease FtsH|nr:ATP-dependent metallopeptidase FtsH/Yme1/Tma family protein [Clostridiales bacterium]
MRKVMIPVMAVLILILITAGIYSINTHKHELSYPSFLEAVEEGRVAEVIINEEGNTFDAYLSDNTDRKYTVPNPKFEGFTEFLLVNNIVVSYKNKSFSNIAGVIVLAAIAIGIIYYTRGGGSAKSLIKDANKKDESARITLDSVAGNIEAKSMVEDIIGFIKNPTQYTDVGARMPKGLLFYGPPGTGKTLMAKAIAGEADVPFYAMSGSDFVQMYVGVGASRIRSLFNKAKKHDKAVIFIDEIDAIGKKRARNSSASNDERDQTLNALLTEMSGFHDNQGIVVIGATNRMDTLDEALLRPGRFDRQIEIGLPDVNSREKILRLHSKHKPLSDDVDLRALAKSTVGFSGAMLENLLNEAAITAANDHKSLINQKHIDRAFYTVLAGAPKTDLSYISTRERGITAYHEAGHALVTKLLLPENYISKVTIIPSVRGAGGFNLCIPKDTMYQTQRQILGSIKILLAGRAAEELIFGPHEITTGASNDIQKASSLIVDYTNKYGMDPEMGLFSTQIFQEGIDSELIEKCRTMINNLYQETKVLLNNNISALENIAKELLMKESLSGEEIDQLVA